MQSPKFTAEEAAQRYAEDEEFAREFDRRLAGLYKEHMARLERLALKIGAVAADDAHPRQRGERGMPRHEPTKLTSEQLLAVLRGSSNPLTRGKIALQLGVDSKEMALTQLLRVLKKEGVIRQRGDRRGARYFLAPAAGKRRRSPSAASEQNL